MKPRVAILGSGSWATALAKLALTTQGQINWFIRRPEVIEEFKIKGKNPSYLS
ncbi:MAG: NAD(P)H-dependent glycerol-3-phosphate dehydrogenase, partial [Prevotella sp.]